MRTNLRITGSVDQFVDLRTSDLQTKPDGSFRTGDIFLQHPTRLGLYKCIGRMTDEIKIRPVGHENVALHAPTYEDVAMAPGAGVLEEAVLFGSGRPEAGILLFVKAGCDVDREGLVDSVWEALEREFEEGRVPVKVRKEMLVVVCGGVVPRTTKGNFVRSEIYIEFEEDINEAYTLV
ncbi:hypothetical protein HYALB_00006878 [Hymenoscyphus albidus]|uniref:Uncharacterized protein n=1 Tax=Hymenoscyphus albidus TaxID=595503 RepID=A0A9N9LJQ0_9HELO|nr:hypothetical protein HYALB_00006878 [Hymenoscyphus albidus]